MIKYTLLIIFLRNETVVCCLLPSSYASINEQQTSLVKVTIDLTSIISQEAKMTFRTLINQIIEFVVNYLALCGAGILLVGIGYVLHLLF
jgi:hypothetical protein